MGSGASREVSYSNPIQVALPRQPSSAKNMSNGGTPPQYSNRQVPPPLPPLQCKAQVFMEEDYRYVDEHVKKTPQKLNKGTFRELVTYLTSNPKWDDMAKVRAIFRWVTSVDVFSMKLDRDPPKQSPMEYFVKIRNNTGNHAYLVNGLCQMAGIPCEVISGMNKSAAYEIGKLADRKTMGAQWNAVYVAENWRFLDTFWASACVVGKKTGEWALVDADSGLEDDEEEITEGETQHRINEFYFLPDPEHFIWTHFPDETKWQLLKEPVSVESFQEHFYVRERFHLLRMSETPQSQLPCVLRTQDGEVDLEFGLPADNSAQLRYKYMLYRSRTKCDTSAETYLDRFVLFEHRQDLLRFSIRFPIKGTFKMDIYGLDIGISETFDLCCTYVIECPQAKTNCLPLPDCPPLGWGPVQKTAEAGLKPVSHEKAQVLAKDGYVEIRLDKEKAVALHQQLKHAVLDDATLSKYCLTRLDDDEVVVYLRLPQTGEYALKMFAQEPGAQGDAENVLNYLIQCQGQTDQIKPFPNTSHGTLGKGPDADRFRVKSLSHPGGTIHTQNGKVSVRFAADDKAELVCEVHTIDGLAAKRVQATRRNENGEWVFDLDLPESGEYSLNVFAKEKGADSEMHNVHTYLVNSDGHELDEEDKKRADDNKEYEVINETVETSDKEVFIPVLPGCENAVVEFHRRNGQKSPDAEPVELIRSDGMAMFRLSLEDYGEYMLNVYVEDTPGSGKVRNVAKYQVNRRRPGELYSGNLNAIMDNIQDEESTSTRQIPPPAGSDVIAASVSEALCKLLSATRDKESQTTEEDTAETESKNSWDDDEGSPKTEDSKAELSLAEDSDGSCRTNPLQSCKQTSPHVTSGQTFEATENVMLTFTQTSALIKAIQAASEFEIGTKLEEERRLKARKAVQQAMDLKDLKQLEAAIARYKDTGVPEDDPMLQKAEKLLVALQVKAELMEASQRRDLTALEKALKRAKEVNFDHQLDVQIALATRLKEHLARLEKLRHAVLNMDQKVVAELKTYGSPPSGVHESMMATFLLLGSSLKEVQQWRTCQVLMAKTGRESMMRKISKFDPRSVPLKVAERAKKISSAFSTDQIRDASAGAAAFYIWAQGMIEEVESYGGAEQADQLRLQK